MSAEGVLAQWFTPEVLGTYATSIGKSPNGNAATLAARIASAWSHPDFQSPNLLSDDGGGGPTSEAAAGDGPPVKRAKLLAAALAGLADSDSESDEAPSMPPACVAKAPKSGGPETACGAVEPPATTAAAWTSYRAGDGPISIKGIVNCRISTRAQDGGWVDGAAVVVFK